MALKKNDDFDFKDDQFLMSGEDDFNFDDLESFENEGGPVKKASKMVFGVTTSAAKGAIQGIHAALRGGMFAPGLEGYGDAVDLISETGGSIVDLFKETLDEGKKGWMTTKRIALNFLPMTKKVIPKGMYDWAENALSKDLPTEDNKSPEEREEESRNNQINTTLVDIFKASEKGNRQRFLSDENNRMVDRVTTKRNHQQVLSAIASLDKRARYISTFLGGTYTDYLKKDLELKYRGYFLTRDIHKYVKGMASVMEQKLEAIKINAALPDAIKAEHNEALKKRRAGRSEHSAEKFNKSFGANIIKGLKERLDPVKLITRDLLPMMQDMSDTYSGMADMMAPTKMDTAKSIIGTGAKWATQLLFPKFMDKHEGFFKLLGGDLSYLTKNLGTIANTFKKTHTSGLMGFLADLLPGFDRDNTVKNAVAKDPTGAAVFDNLTRESIVTVIPAHLERLGACFDALNAALGVTVEESHKKVWDVTKNQMVTEAEMRKTIHDREYGNDQERYTRSQDDLAVFKSNLMVKYGVEHVKDLEKNEEAKKELDALNAASKSGLITRMFSELGDRNINLDMKIVKEFADNPDKLNDVQRDYIRSVFGEISPETVNFAKVIVDNTTRNGYQDSDALRSINSRVGQHVAYHDKIDKRQDKTGDLGQNRWASDRMYTEAGAFINETERIADAADQGEEGDIVQYNYKTGKKTVVSVDKQREARESSTDSRASHQKRMAKFRDEVREEFLEKCKDIDLTPYNVTPEQFLSYVEHSTGTASLYLGPKAHLGKLKLFTIGEKDEEKDTVRGEIIRGERIPLQNTFNSMDGLIDDTQSWLRDKLGKDDLKIIKIRQYGEQFDIDVKDEKTGEQNSIQTELPYTYTGTGITKELIEDIKRSIPGGRALKYDEADLTRQDFFKGSGPKVEDKFADKLANSRELDNARLGGTVTGGRKSVGEGNGSVFSHIAVDVHAILELLRGNNPGLPVVNSEPVPPTTPVPPAVETSTPVVESPVAVHEVKPEPEKVAETVTESVNASLASTTEETKEEPKQEASSTAKPTEEKKGLLAKIVGYFNNSESGKDDKSSGDEPMTTLHVDMPDSGPSIVSRVKNKVSSWLHRKDETPIKDENIPKVDDYIDPDAMYAEADSSVPVIENTKQDKKPSLLSRVKSKISSLMKRKKKPEVEHETNVPKVDDYVDPEAMYAEAASGEYDSGDAKEEKESVKEEPTKKGFISSIKGIFSRARDAATSKYKAARTKEEVEKTEKLKEEAVSSLKEARSSFRDAWHKLKDAWNKGKESSENKETKEGGATVSGGKKSGDNEQLLISFEGDAESKFHADFRLFANKALNAIANIKGFTLPGMDLLSGAWNKVKGMGSSLLGAGKGVLGALGTGAAALGSGTLAAAKGLGSLGLAGVKGLGAGALAAGKGLVNLGGGVVGGLSKLLPAAGSAISGTINAGGKLIGGALSGTGSAIKGAYEGAKKVVPVVLDAGKKVAGATWSAIKSPFKLAKKGYDLAKTGYGWAKEHIHMPKSLKNAKAWLFGGEDAEGNMKQSIFKRAANAVKNLLGFGDSPDYVDIYRKDNYELGHPILKATTQESGVFFADGSGKVSKSRDINKPVVDKDNNTLISQEDINVGLVDKDGNSIYDKRKNIFQKMISGAKKMIAGVGKVLGAFIPKAELNFGLGGKLYKDRVVYYLDAIARNLGCDVKIDISDVHTRLAGASSKKPGLLARIGGGIKSLFTRKKKLEISKFTDEKNLPILKSILEKRGITIENGKLIDDEGEEVTEDHLCSIISANIEKFTVKKKASMLSRLTGAIGRGIGALGRGVNKLGTSIKSMFKKKSNTKDDMAYADPEMMYAESASNETPYKKNFLERWGDSLASKGNDQTVSPEELRAQIGATDNPEKDKIENAKTAESPYQAKMLAIVTEIQERLRAIETSGNKTVEELKEANKEPDKNGTLEEEGSAADQYRDIAEANAKRKAKFGSKGEDGKGSNIDADQLKTLLNGNGGKGSGMLSTILSVGALLAGGLGGTVAGLGSQLMKSYGPVAKSIGSGLSKATSWLKGTKVGTKISQMASSTTAATKASKVGKAASATAKAVSKAVSKAVKPFKTAASSIGKAASKMANSSIGSKLLKPVSKAAKLGGKSFKFMSKAAPWLTAGMEIKETYDRSKAAANAIKAAADSGDTSAIDKHREERSWKNASTMDKIGRVASAVGTGGVSEAARLVEDAAMQGGALMLENANMRSSANDVNMAYTRAQHKLSKRVSEDNKKDLKDLLGTIDEKKMNIDDFKKTQDVRLNPFRWFTEDYGEQQEMERKQRAGKLKMDITNLFAAISESPFIPQDSKKNLLEAFKAKVPLLMENNQTAKDWMQYVKRLCVKDAKTFHTVIEDAFSSTLKGKTVIIDVIKNGLALDDNALTELRKIGTEGWVDPNAGKEKTQNGEIAKAADAAASVVDNATSSGSEVKAQLGDKPKEGEPAAADKTQNDKRYYATKTLFITKTELDKIAEFYDFDYFMIKEGLRKLFNEKGESSGVNDRVLDHLDSYIDHNVLMPYMVNLMGYDTYNQISQIQSGLYVDGKLVNNGFAIADIIQLYHPAAKAEKEETSATSKGGATPTTGSTAESSIKAPAGKKSKKKGAKHREDIGDVMIPKEGESQSEYEEALQELVKNSPIKGYENLKSIYDPKNFEKYLIARVKIEKANAETFFEDPAPLNQDKGARIAIGNKPELMEVYNTVNGSDIAKQVGVASDSPIVPIKPEDKKQDTKPAKPSPEQAAKETEKTVEQAKAPAESPKTVEDPKPVKSQLDTIEEWKNKPSSPERTAALKSVGIDFVDDPDDIQDRINELKLKDSAKSTENAQAITPVKEPPKVTSPERKMDVTSKPDKAEALIAAQKAESTPAKTIDIRAEMDKALAKSKEAAQAAIARMDTDNAPKPSPEQAAKETVSKGKANTKGRSLIGNTLVPLQGESKEDYLASLTALQKFKPEIGSIYTEEGRKNYIGAKSMGAWMSRKSYDQASDPVLKALEEKPELHSNLLDTALELANSPNEKAVTYDSNGKRRELTSGDKYSVSPDMHEGDNVIHNHPDASPTSETDVKSAIDAGLNSISTIRPKFDRSVLGKVNKLSSAEASKDFGGLLEDTKKDMDMSELKPSVSMRKTDLGNAIMETVDLSKANKPSTDTTATNAELNSMFGDLIKGTTDLGKNLLGIDNSTMSNGELLQGIYNKLDMIIKAIVNHNATINEDIGNSAKMQFDLMKKYTDIAFQPKEVKPPKIAQTKPAINISK